MSMWEIDELLSGSISLIKDSNLTNNKKRNIIWNLETYLKNMKWMLVVSRKLRTIKIHLMMRYFLFNLVK